MSTVCPYCNIEVSESAIEAEDGCCPECGAMISAASSFLDEPDDGDEYSDYENDDVFGNFDDEEEDDDDFARADLDDDIFLGDDDDEFFDEEFALDEEDDFDSEEEFDDGEFDDKDEF